MLNKNSNDPDGSTQL